MPTNMTNMTIFKSLE